MGSFFHYGAALKWHLGMAAGLATVVLAAPTAWADEPSTGGDTGAAADTSGAANANAAPPPAAPVEEEKITDVLEQKGQGYYFLGLNYRGTIVPKFMVNMFVDEGATFYSNTGGLSFDYRKDHFSIVTGLNFTDYSFDPVLFLQKGKNPGDPGNWGVVHSNLHAVYLTVDLLWSVPIAKKGQVDFEFGFSAGLGGVFGDLYNTWVTDQTQPAGTPQFVSSSGKTYYQCVATGPNGCNYTNHSGTTADPTTWKVGSGAGYREKNWFDSGGGSVPTVFPWLSLPILGFRFKPIKEMEARVNGGFSITGFFFNLALYYGFENPKSSPH